jgi:hypothetical protein
MFTEARINRRLIFCQVKNNLRLKKDLHGAYENSPSIPIFTGDSAVRYGCCLRCLAQHALVPGSGSPSQWRKALPGSRVYDSSHLFPSPLYYRKSGPGRSSVAVRSTTHALPGENHFWKSRVKGSIQPPLTLFVLQGFTIYGRAIIRPLGRSLSGDF